MPYRPLLLALALLIGATSAQADDRGRWTAAGSFVQPDAGTRIKRCVRIAAPSGVGQTSAYGNQDAMRQFPWLTYDTTGALPARQRR